MTDRLTHNPFEALRAFNKPEESAVVPETASHKETEPMDTTALAQEISLALGADAAQKERIISVLARAAQGYSTFELENTIMTPGRNLTSNPESTRAQKDAFYDAKEKIEPVIQNGKIVAAIRSLRQLAAETDPEKRKQLVGMARTSAMQGQQALVNIAREIGVSLHEWPDIENETVRPGKYIMEMRAVNREGKPAVVQQGINLSFPGKDTVALEKEASGWVSMVGLHNHGIPAGEVELTLTHEKDPNHQYTFSTKIDSSGHIDKKV